MANETYDADQGDEDDAVPPSGPKTGWARLSDTFLNPPKPKNRSAGGSAKASGPVDMSRMTDAEKRTLINQIDPMEKKIGLAAAALAALLTIIANVPYMINKTSVATSVKPVGKTCSGGYVYTTNSNSAPTCNGIYPASHYAFYLVILLVFSLAIFVTVRIGRRAPLAFAITLTGLALGSFVASTIVVLPFLAAGGWLLLRAWRSQRYGSPSAKTPIPGYVPPARGAAARANAKNGTAPAASSRSGSSTTNAGRRSRKNQAPVSQTGRQPTAPNKRYTPKAPPKKKPSPTD